MKIATSISKFEFDLTFFLVGIAAWGMVAGGLLTGPLINGLGRRYSRSQEQETQEVLFDFVFHGFDAQPCVLKKDANNMRFQNPGNAKRGVRSTMPI